MTIRSNGVWGTTPEDDEKCRQYAAMLTPIREVEYQKRGGNAKFQWEQHYNSKRAEYAVWHMLGDNPEDEPDIMYHDERSFGADVKTYSVKFCSLNTSINYAESWIYQYEPQDPILYETYLTTQISEHPFAVRIYGPVQPEDIKANLKLPINRNPTKRALYAEDIL